MPGLDLFAIMPNRIHGIGFIVDVRGRGEKFFAPTIISRPYHRGNIQGNVRGNVWGDGALSKARNFPFCLENRRIV